MPSSVLERLHHAAGSEATGSVTLFTNGERVMLGSVTIAADLRDAWLQERLLERTVNDLERLVPGLPWSEGSSP